MIDWRHDEANNTWEGWVGDTMIYDIEIRQAGVILYKMREHVGNYMEFDSLEQAQRHCEKKLEPIA